MAARPTLLVILAAALVLRLALVVALRHKLTHDALIFINWAHLLMRYGTHGLYAHVDTIDHYPVNYPPGYGLLLVAVVQVYRAIVPAGAQTDVLLGELLKVPAIAADLVLCVLAYWIVRRWRGTKAGLVAAALAAFLPSTWPVSALWGQVDSICAMFTVLALASSISRNYLYAWIALALAVLIKPMPVIVAPLLLVRQVQDAGLAWRSLLGPAAGVTLAYLAALPFTSTANPAAVFGWLARHYVAGSSLTDQTSVNAYNIWTLAGPSVSDSLKVYGLALHTWGALFVAAFLCATLIRYAGVIRSEPDRSAREQAETRAWFLVLAAFFMLATRMHERYILFALALTPLLWFCGNAERKVVAVLTTTFVLCVVLVLGFYEHRTFAEIPAITHALSIVNVATLAVAAIAFFKRSAGTHGVEVIGERTQRDVVLS